ncbi:MAG: DUF4271 domain-containing protein, partial [Muribaculaceae bacterium]|nr:DUF4271 domain-containing protein [Muribaculaceae bacterium]
MALTSLYTSYTSAGLPIPPALPDSLLTDTITEPVYGLVMESPIIREQAVEKNPEETGMSIVWLVLVLLFCAVALKFKNNAHYLKALVSDLTDVRVRQNAFDDTVKEASFLILLNVLWFCCAGILLWQCVRLTSPDVVGNSFSIPDKPSLGIAVCTAMAGIYALFMTIGYWLIGYVFTDKDRA